MAGQNQFPLTLPFTESRSVNVQLKNAVARDFGGMGCYP